jgi:ParB/RepB/Spo0J family partition protein
MPPRRKGAAVIEKKNRSLERLEIQYLAADKIKPNEYNPNRQNEHEFTMLVSSIQEDGFTQPVIVAEDFTIVDGEHRWRAAMQVGLKEIPVVVVPMDAAQARIATLRHNRARGSEDMELAVEVLRDLEKLGALDWAADSLDMSDDELQRLLTDIAAPDALAGEEFSEAWTPMGGALAQDGDFRSDATADHTPDAMAQARQQEQRLRDARSEEERQAIQRDSRLFRLALSFTGEEADVVRSALGDAPAMRVLTWCKGWHESQQTATTPPADSQEPPF